MKSGLGVVLIVVIAIVLAVVVEVIMIAVAVVVVIAIIAIFEVDRAFPFQAPLRCRGGKGVCEGEGVAPHRVASAVALPWWDGCGERAGSVLKVHPVAAKWRPLGANNGSKVPKMWLWGRRCRGSIARLCSYLGSNMRTAR